jgi:hypothetical protein
MLWEKAYEIFGYNYWHDLMIACNANVCDMARRSGLHRSNVYRELKRFEIVLPENKQRYGNWGDL